MVIEYLNWRKFSFEVSAKGYQILFSWKFKNILSKLLKQVIDIFRDYTSVVISLQWKKLRLSTKTKYSEVDWYLNSYHKAVNLQRMSHNNDLCCYYRE